MVTSSGEKQGSAAQPVRDVTFDAVRCITWPRFWLLMGEGCSVVVGSSRGTENGEPISIVCCCAACEEEPAGGKAPACVWDSSEELCLDRSSSAILFPDRFVVC
jgi:hypothetical protein